MQGWPTQIGFWAALGKNTQKYQLFGPHFDENNEKLSKISKNQGRSIRVWAAENYFWPLLTYLLYSHTPVEHRPSVFSFHRWRFLTWARSSPNDVFSHSAKTVRLQVALGRPRDLLPCGLIIFGHPCSNLHSESLPWLHKLITIKTVYAR